MWIEDEKEEGSGAYLLLRWVTREATAGWGGEVGAGQVRRQAQAFLGFLGEISAGSMVYLRCRILGCSTEFYSN